MNILNIIHNIKRRRKIPKIGDYVIAYYWKDLSPNDPWYVGHVEKMDEKHFKLIESVRWFRHARIITAEEGNIILKEYPKMELAG